MQTMSITRGLTELKRLQDRIETAISSGKYLARTEGQNKFLKVVGTNESVEAMVSKIQASFDSVDSLINLRQRIKSAIVTSNAKTFVEVMGQTMTVAECIELKSTVAFKRQLLATLKNVQAREMIEVEKANAALEARVDALLTTIYGADKTKVGTDTYQAVAGPQKEQKQVELLDPQKIGSRIEKLTEEISVIETELDIILSETNSVTTIEV
jgi:hypothetical protein